MGCTVEDLLARITSRELTEWAAFEREYGPLGPERGDWQAALVAHTLAGASGGKRSRVSDYLIRWSGRRQQSAEDQLTVLKALTSRGGRDVNDS